VDAVRRTEWHDWYVDGDESAVFVGDQVMALSALATTILRTVPEDGTAGLDDLTAALVAAYGEPEGPVDELVTEKVTELVERGVLAWVSGTP
jgi:hypothetical protein